MAFKPIVSLPPLENSSIACVSDINGVQYWEAGTSSNSSSANSSSIELQGNSSIFENSIFSWGLTDCRVESSDLTSDKEAPINLEGEPEDIKWSEFLPHPFSMTSGIQSQSQNNVSTRRQLFDCLLIRWEWVGSNNNGPPKLLTTFIFYLYGGDRNARSVSKSFGVHVPST